MNNGNNTEETLELTVLANMVRYPEHAFRVIDGLGITADDFSPGSRRDAFSAMLRKGGDTHQLSAAIIPILPDQLSTNEGQDRFLDLAPSIGEVEHHLLQFVKHGIRRDLSKQLWETSHNHNLPIELLVTELIHVINGHADRLEKLCNFVSGPSADNADDQTVNRTPEELLNVPGFVNELVEYTLSVAPRPNRVLAFAGALAMLSFLTARKYTDKYETATNIYMIALADSGVGKDIIRKVNKRLADNVNLSECIADGIGSGEGLEDALFVTPAKLALMDEFSTLLNSLKESTSLNEHILCSLLNFFTESKSVHTVRLKALTSAMKQTLMDNPSAAEKIKSAKIYHPSLTLLATSIPDKFYSSLTSRLMDNGLLARFLIFEAGERGEANLKPLNQPLPRTVLAFAQELATQNQSIPRDKEPSYITINDAEGTDEVRANIRTEADALYRACQKKKDSAGMSVWNRAVEIANKLALLYALSENLYSPSIKPQAIEWAWKVVVHSSKRMLTMSQTYLSVDRDDDDANKVYRHLQHCGRKGARRSDVTYALHLSKIRMDRAEETLKDRDLIEVIIGEKNSKIYRAKNKKGKK